MEVYTGKTISKGITTGKLYFYTKDRQQVKRYRIEGPQKELERFERAKERAMEDLNALYEKAVQEVGAVNAEIFQVHVDACSRIITNTVFCAN